MKIVLEDNFKSKDLDKNNWRHEITCWGGGNGEFQMYTPEAANTYIKNRELYLRPTFTADSDFGQDFRKHATLDVRKKWDVCTNHNENGFYREGKDIPPIMSSKLISNASISHGRVEVEAKLPKGDWIWPAIWLLPTDSKYGVWPASGEIDIMEARGNLDLKDLKGDDMGLNVVSSTIHWAPKTGQHGEYGKCLKKPGSGTWADEYHIYSLDWTTDHIRMYVDNHQVLQSDTPAAGYGSYGGKGGKDAPFDEKFSLILNVAVGGNFFNGCSNPKPWTSSSPDAMVKFWDNRAQWQSTWRDEDTAMKIRSVKMIQK